MELQEILAEMETLLDSNCFDEGWSDWLRDVADQVAHYHSQREKVMHLLQLRKCEAALRHLQSYLPGQDGSDECPSERLSVLISALDATLHRDLAELAATEPQ